MEESSAKLMLGKPVAEAILAECRRQAQAVVEHSGIRPCLAVVLVGGDPLAGRFLERKGQACEQLGMASVLVRLPVTISTAALVARLTELGNDPAVHALLLQYPLPPGIVEVAAFEAIPRAKDVDGIGLSQAAGFNSCTAEAVRRLLAAYQVRVAGRQAVVAGRGATLGEPLANMLVTEDAVVTICDAPRPGMERWIESGELVVTAVGQPRWLRGEWLKPGAVVVDTGLNTVEGKPVGDVDFESAVRRASLITPAPGGVGPVTLAVLLERTVRAAARQLGSAPRSLAEAERNFPSR